MGVVAYWSQGEKVGEEPGSEVRIEVVLRVCSEQSDQQIKPCIIINRLLTANSELPDILVLLLRWYGMNQTIHVQETHN